MRFPLTVETESLASSLASGRGSLSAAIPLTVPAPDPGGQTLPQPPAYTALGSLSALAIFKCLGVAALGAAALYGVRKSRLRGLGYGNTQHGVMANNAADRFYRIAGQLDSSISLGECSRSAGQLMDLHQVYGNLASHIQAAGINTDLKTAPFEKQLKQYGYDFKSQCKLVSAGGAKSRYQYYKTGTVKSRTRGR